MERIEQHAGFGGSQQVWKHRSEVRLRHECGRVPAAGGIGW